MKAKALAVLILVLFILIPSTMAADEKNNKDEKKDTLRLTAVEIFEFVTVVNRDPSIDRQQAVNFLQNVLDGKVTMVERLPFGGRDPGLCVAASCRRGAFLCISCVGDKCQCSACCLAFTNRP